MTIHAVLNNQTYPCAYIFFERKITKTYILGLEQIRNLCFPKNLKRVLCDFESSLMKSIVSVFPGVDLKSCWFHLSQALRRRLFSMGFKEKYLGNWQLRFWLKRFVALAFIPIEKLQDGINIIIDEINGSMAQFLQKYGITIAHKKKQTMISRAFTQNLIDCIKREETKTCNLYQDPTKKPKQAMHNERNQIEFKNYFDNLTHQVMSPYEQEIDEELEEFSEEDDVNEEPIKEMESKIKVVKLSNKYKDLNFIGNIQSSKSEKKDNIAEAIIYPETIYVEKNVQVQPVTNFIEDNEWLISRHIDLALDYKSKRAIFRGHFNLSIIELWKIDECMRNNFFLQASPDVDKIFFVNVSSVHWILLTNINPTNISPSDKYYGWDQTIEEEWYVYDSMNNINNVYEASHIFRLLYPNKNCEKVSM
ncbi:ac transposable element-derived 3, partial [Brachionus plicatilis]